MFETKYFLMGCFAVTSIYHFMLFLFYKKSYAALYFSMITGLSFTLLVTQNSDWFYKYKIVLLVFLIVPMLFLHFTKALFPEEFKGKKQKIILNILHVLCSISIMIVILLPNQVFIPLNPTMQKITIAFDVFVVLNIITRMIKAALNKNSDAWLILCGYIILFGSALLIYSTPSKMENTNNPIGALGMLIIYSYPSNTIHVENPPVV